MAAKMTKSEVAAICASGIQQAVGFGDTRLAREREKVQRYRDAELPARSGPNDSGFVSMDVYEGQEAMKAQLLEVFSGNKQPIKFDCAHGETPAQSRVRTDYLTDVIFSQNRGFELFQTVIDNGLSARTAVAKCRWETDKTTDTYDLSAPTMQEIGQFIQNNPSAEIDEYDFDDNGETVKRVRFTVTKDRSQAVWEAVDPSEFGISARAESIPKAQLCFHRQRKSKSDLLDLGFDRSDVAKVQDNDRLWADMSPEITARFEQTDDTGLPDSLETGAAKKTCMLYECYVKLDFEGKGKTKLWQVFLVGDTVMSMDKVRRAPFVPFTPLPKPHTFWGANFGLQLVQIQNARTYLTRSIINHAITTNNPRLMVVKGSVMNPRELTENRYGGIVNVARPDGIIPLPQAGLNPYVYQTMGAMKAAKEEITGISGLSQGLDKDAVSKQNSGDMIHELISVSQIRQKIIARNFAESFLRDLYTMLYEIVCENEDRAKIVRVAGAWTPVDFTQWPEDTRMSVGIALGYGEAQKDAQRWLAVAKVLGSDPDLRPNFGAEQKYNVYKEAMIASGIRDTDTYLLPMDKITPPQPDPMMEADLAVKHADAKVKLANAQAAVESLKLKQGAAIQKNDEHNAKIDLATKKEADSFDLKHAEFQHQVMKDNAELLLQKHVADVAQKSTATAFVSP